MNKRGQGQQFNWIFIVFAGAIILFFFISFGVKYMNLKESQNNVEIAFGLDNMISGLRTTTLYKNYSTSFPFILNHSCNAIRVNHDYKLDMRDKIIFMPKEMEVDEIIVWTEAFEYPFLIDNLIYFVFQGYIFYLYYGY